MKILAILFLALFLAAGVSAQQKKATPKKGTAKKAVAPKNNDNTFIVNAINGDLMEIELGGYAEKFGADERVKTYGSMMVRDHKRTKTELKSIASDKNMTVSDAMDAKHKARVDALEQKKGSEFDKLYMDMMVSDHAKDLAEFRRAQVNDNHLKEVVRKATTLMQTHLDAAKEVQAYLKSK